MPLRYEIRDPVICFETEGDVEYGEGLEVLRSGIAAARAERAAGSWDVLFDIRRSSEQRSSDELRGIASFVAEQLGDEARRCAIVANDAFHFGLGRMFGAYSESLGMEVWVFHELPAAEAWLRSDVASG